MPASQDLVSGSVTVDIKVRCALSQRSSEQKA
jgi:hypothetical protein